MRQPQILRASSIIVTVALAERPYTIKVKRAVVVLPVEARIPDQIKSAIYGSGMVRRTQ